MDSDFDQPSIIEANSIIPRENFPDVLTADGIKTTVLAGISGFDSVKNSAGSQHGIESFRNVKPEFLVDLFNSRAQRLGLSLSEYKGILARKQDQRIVDNEMHYYEGLVAFEGTTGSRAVPLEGFLGRSPIDTSLTDIFTKRLDNNSRGDLSFRFYALGDGSETVQTVDLVDDILTKLSRHYSPRQHTDDLKADIASDLGLSFSLYDINASILDNCSNVVKELSARYPWFRNRARLSFRNILDSSINDNEDSTAVIFARNIFSGRAVITSKTFLENAVLNLIDGGLLLTDLSAATAIALLQKENPQLRKLTQIYKEDQYNDIQRAAVLFKLDKS